MFFCNSRDIHVTSVPDSHTNYKYLVVQLSYEQMMSYCDEEDSCYFAIENESIHAQLVEQFEKLLAVLDKDTKFSSLKKTQIILEIYYILLTRCQVKDVSNMTKIHASTTYAKQLIAYINQHYTEDLSLEILAKEVGLSAQYLSKHFKNATDMEILQYINLIRLEHANEDLMNDSVTVTQAALNNGFRLRLSNPPCNII